jgi:sodium/proline symporter
MAVASILLPLTALIAVGGLSELVTGLRAVETEGFLSLTQNLPWVAASGFILGLLGIGIGYPGQPHVVNRFMALKRGDSSMRRARRIAVLWAVIVYSGMLTLGLCGRILYPALADREVIFLVVTNGLFPPVVAGVLLAAVLSAIMSTADSQLLVAASSVTQDLKLGGRSGRSFLFRSRAVVLLLSLGAVMGALYGSQEIFNQVLFAWTAMGSAFGPLLLVTVLRGPVGARATIWAMLLGFGLSVLAYSFPETRGTAVERVLPFLVSLSVAWAGQSKDHSQSTES